MPGKSKVHSFLETVWAFNQLSKEQQNSIAEGMEKFTEETERQRLALLCRGLEAARTELRGAIAKARLEEAQWWERLVDEEHHDEFLAEGEACIYCEHIAELKAAARQAAESPGRAGWQMSQQIAAAERSLAEVSADGVVEACAVIAERNHTTAFIPRDIRALKGTFSLRASGTPDTVTMSTVDFGRMLTQERERAAKIAENCGSLSIAKQIRDPNIRRLAAAPTLSEAGACPECHRSDRHDEGCPWDRPPSAKLSDSEKASWNEDLNAKKWDG